MCSLENKVAIVTGSSRGIGEAIARNFLTAGASVVINGRDQQRLEETASMLRGCGFEKVAAVAADVSKSSDVTRLFDMTLERFGRLDILVNNAGVVKNSLLARMAEQEWDWVLENNLKSAYLCTRRASRILMKQKSGRIINISSVVALGGNPFQSNYAASKSGLDGMMMATAKELAPYGVTVNSVAPGYIVTDMTRDLPEAAIQEILHFIPLHRAGTVDEVAHAVRFLAADESAYITGQVIQVDGGRVIR